MSLGFTAGSDIKEVKQSLCSLGQVLRSPRLLFTTRLLVVSTFRKLWREASGISPRHPCGEADAASPLQPPAPQRGALVGPPLPLPRHPPSPPALVSTYCFTSPTFGNTEGAKNTSVTCTFSSQQVPDRLVKKAFFCTGGTCWYSFWLAHPPVQRGSSGCSVLGRDGAPQQGPPVAWAVLLP